MANYKRFYIFDNGGETLDRYTIVHSKSGDIFGASSMPFSPLGFAQYCGNVMDRMNITIGYSWQRGRTKRNLNAIKNDELRNYINEARKEKHLGVEVKETDLPDEVRKYLEYINKPTT